MCGRDVETKSDRIQAALGAEQLGRAVTIAAAYSGTTRSAVAVLTILNQVIKALHSADQKRRRKRTPSTRTMRRQ